MDHTEEKYENPDLKFKSTRAYLMKFYRGGEMADKKVYISIIMVSYLLSSHLYVFS
ncbi:hypothetical protein SFC65_15105 [Priestia filamentosa]|uniref:hypothetical protein n=1 Tax=Priestia filamentosa TaxID=1402861 RepID=UPI0039821907